MIRVGSRFSFLRDMAGWKRFAFEVAIIVVGVLLAIWLEGIVSDRRTAKEAEYHRSLIENQLAGYRIDAIERIAVEPCRIEQFEALRDALMNGKGDWPGSEAVLKEAGITAIPSPNRRSSLIATPSRVFSFSTFDAARQAGVLDFFKPYEVVRYQVFYGVAERHRGFERDIHALNARLFRLNVPGPMGAQERRAALADLAEFDINASILALSLGQYVGLMDGLLPFASLDEDAVRTYEKYFEEGKAKSAERYGDCAVFPEHLFDPIEDPIKG